MILSLLMFPGCPNSPKMGANLAAALKSLHLPQAFESVDLLKLPKDDPRTGYAAPTILIDGVDLFGSKARPPGKPSCRLYPGGVPTARMIATKLLIVEAARQSRAEKPTNFEGGSPGK